MTVKRKSYLFRSISYFLLFLALLGPMQGCAAMKPVTPATANQDVTIAIAAAGAAAQSAEAQYNSGALPQTPGVRAAINAVGTAYNDARAAWLTVLTAEAVYQGAQSTQIAACAPPTSGTSTAAPIQINGQAITCSTATANANSAQGQVTASQAALATKVAAMNTATANLTATTKQ